MKINKLLFYYISILVLELTFKIFAFKTLFNMSLLYIIIFSIPFALFIYIFTSLFKPKVNRILNIIVMVALFLTFETQFIFYKLFSVILSLNSLGMADQAADNIPVVIEAILKNIVGFVFISLPLMFYIILNKKITNNTIKFKKSLLLIIITIFIFMISLLILVPNKKELYSPYQLYYSVHEPNITVEKMGLLTTVRLDIKRYIFGFNSDIIIDEKKPNIETEKEIKYNITNIDFNKLKETETNKSILSLHSYFENATPTKQNEYTGLFKGKNLIFILVEGWNSIAVDKDITPTMYKLTNEGFVFNNFYNPVFLSTTGGEFQSMTSLIPNQTILKKWKTGTVDFPYAIGNMFAKEGYKTKAIHDWTYTYYNRQVTMKTLGFDDFLGCDNGLEKLMTCNSWPTSDLEMFTQTPKYFLESENPFAIDYITVSGHALYSFGGNNMASKNKLLVKDLDYPDSIKAYLASQIETDKGIEELLRQLEESGKLDNTVIVMVGDHYPYSLSTDEINTISTYKRDSLFEVNHSNLVIWSKDAVKTEINKVGGSIDILPTLLNLFGIEYDSRLLVGKDLLSDTEGLVMFSNRSWISDYGRYDTSTKVFTPDEDTKIEDNYVTTINNKVYNNFSISELIVMNEYYNKLLGD